MTSKVDSVRSSSPVPISQISPRRSIPSGVAEVPTVLETAEESKSTKPMEPGFFETLVVSFIQFVGQAVRAIWNYLKVKVILKFSVESNSLQPTEPALSKSSLNLEKK